MKVKAELEIDMTPKLLAETFCVMSDEEQAQFFIEVAKVASRWQADRRTSLGPTYQWWLVGKHLRTCECSSEDARDVIREIALGMEPRHD